MDTNGKFIGACIAIALVCIGIGAVATYVAVDSGVEASNAYYLTEKREAERDQEAANLQMNTAKDLEAKANTALEEASARLADAEAKVAEAKALAKEAESALKSAV